MIDERLARLADAAGIEREYWDALGTRHELSEATARGILAALGMDAGSGAPIGDDGNNAPVVSGGSAPIADVRSGAPIADVVHAPSSSAAGAGSADHPCYIPDALRGGARVWGIAVQLDLLRSSRNWGIGDFTDLADLARIAARHGASVVGLNPLHARHLARPHEASPYSPSSRLFIDPLAIDVEAVPDFVETDDAHALVADTAFRTRLDAARGATLVDHAAVSALKLAVLERLFALFETRHADAGDSRRRDFDAFVSGHGDALQRFGEFEALRRVRAAAGLSIGDWREWPAEWRDPSGDTMRRFREEHARDIRFVLYLQWEAARQLRAAADAARDAGLELRFYRDLAVGAARDSAEAWGDQALIACDASIGAPPDAFSAAGQNWGLPPWNPRVLAARRFAPFRSLIAANMEGAGALRIDHVMALTRLFWIPHGMSGSDGAYVRQPFDALAAVLAEASREARCMVIGEDLGSVPDGLRERLHALGILSYRVLLFERNWSGNGSFRRPHEYPAQALATVTTHDLPTIADYWTFGDIARRSRLGLFADEQAREAEIAKRHEERWQLLALMRDCGVHPADPEDTAQVAEALHAIVASTPAMIAMVQLDDVLGETEPINIPGTTSAYSNWRRKLSRTLEEVDADPRLARVATLMRTAGRGR